MVGKGESDICIIGAGIGGLTAGALLTKKGYKVAIFEKEALIGGRALSFDDLTLFTLDRAIFTRHRAGGGRYKVF